jgi:hypothetical protein
MNISSKDRRAIIILAVVGVVAVGAFFMFVRKGSGGTGATTPPVVQPSGSVPVAGGSPSPSPSPEPSSDNGLVFTGRDPFQPLIDTTGGSATTDDTGNPVPAVSPAASPPSAPTGGSSTSVSDHTVVLLDTFTQNGTQMAQVEVDGTVYTVAEGETFADNFQLVSINGSCADFTFNGDTSFTLCQSTGK